GKREADPRDNHGPPLDAAKRVDSLLERGESEQVVDVVCLRLVHEPVYPDRPRPRFERVREPGGVGLVDAELVEVVVRRRRLELRRRLPETLRVVPGGLERLALRGGAGTLAGQKCQRGGAEHPLATRQVVLRVGDVVGGEPRSAADQHAGNASLPVLSISQGGELVTLSGSARGARRSSSLFREQPTDHG